MIAADRRHLEATLRADALEIRDKELTVFSENFSVLATLSSFFTALGFSGFTMVPVWYDTGDKDDGDGYHADPNMLTCEVVFYALVSTSIGFNMLTLCISVWSMIFGPGLALRGPEGSMARAVDGMYVERKWALRSYGFGLVSLMLAGVVLAWLKFGLDGHNRNPSKSSSLGISVVLGIFVIATAIYMRFATRPRFKFPDDYERRPDNITIGGMDPETGDYYDGSARGLSFSSAGKPSSPWRKRATPPNGAGNSGIVVSGGNGVGGGGSGATAVASSRPPDDIQRTALLRSIRDIDWMVQQGLISGAEAQAKKNEAVDNMLFKSDLKVPLVDGQLRQPLGGGKQGKSFLGSFLSGGGSRSIGGSGPSQSQDWTSTPSADSPSPSSQGTAVSSSQAKGMREGPVMHAGKPAILHVDSEMISVLDPRTREARKQWLLTGNFVSCSEKEDRTGIGSIGGLNKRLSRSFSTAGASGATGGPSGGAPPDPPYDQKGPWFLFTVSIGKTKVSMSAPSTKERTAWVEWFMDSQQPTYRRRISTSGNISASLAHLPRA